MADFVSLLDCVRGGGEEETNNDVTDTTDGDNDTLSVEEEKEVSEIVEDLMSMGNKERLKRDLTKMATENVLLRRKVNRLKTLGGSGPRSVELAFQIDVTGTEEPSEEGEESSQNSLLYDSVGLTDCGSALGTKAQPVMETPEKSSRSSCFNCCGSHNMAECPEPRDPRRIAQNRKAFQASAANSSRFFEEGKREAILPGLPSPALREALGLRPDQLPEYVYRLRELGYPPGWLKRAEIRQSGLGIYHGTDKLAEGDKVSEQESLEYDTRKLVSWPGFNDEIPKPFRDEGQRYRVRPQSRCLSLKEMKREMKKKEQKGYRKRKMDDVSTDNISSADMEVEEGECDATIDLTEDSEEMLPPGEEGEIIDKAEAKVNGSVKNCFDSEGVIVQPIGTGNIAKTDTGTPIVEMFSPFESVPDTNKWGVNMSEHVAFENLPNYTGTWDKMKKGVIKKIRERKVEEEEKD